MRDLPFSRRVFKWAQLRDNPVKRLLRKKRRERARALETRTRSVRIKRLNLATDENKSAGELIVLRVLSDRLSRGDAETA